MGNRKPTWVERQMKPLLARYKAELDRLTSSPNPGHKVQDRIRYLKRVLRIWKDHGVEPEVRS